MLKKLLKKLLAAEADVFFLETIFFIEMSPSTLSLHLPLDVLISLFLSESELLDADEEGD